MSTDEVSKWLSEGLAAATTGNHVLARDLLQRVVDAEENNVQGWLWLNGVVNTLEDREVNRCAYPYCSLSIKRETKIRESKMHRSQHRYNFLMIGMLAIVASVLGACQSPDVPDVLDTSVDVGPARLHIHCQGKGSPTVVLESGPGDTWMIWDSVRPEVAKFTRVCAYDRASLGSSVLVGPRPLTSQQMADELATLLDKGKIPGPYVMVSHATSNWIDRLYTAQHRDQVAALVFISPFHEDMISGMLAILASDSTELTNTRLEIANQGEGQSVDDWLTSADQVRAAGTLGDLPLVLLARGTFQSPDLYGKQHGKQIDAMLAKQEQQLLTLSTNSTRLVADKSGHFIQRDQPQAVVEAIQLAIEKIGP